MRRGLRIAFVLGLSLALSGCGGAMQTTADSPVGAGGLKPTVEDKDAGLVGLRPGFALRDYTVIAVERFAVTEPEIKDDEDRELAAAMPAYFQAELVRRLQEAGLFSRVVALSQANSALDSQKSLRLKGVVSRLAPGDQALRYFVGFGAGRSKAQAEMYFVDAGSGQVVLVTADRRAAAYGLFGGDSEDHLKESFSDMARDLVKFLTRLSKGEAPGR